MAFVNVYITSAVDDQVDAGRETWSYRSLLRGVTSNLQTSDSMFWMFCLLRLPHLAACARESNSATFTRYLGSADKFIAVRGGR